MTKKQKIFQKICSGMLGTFVLSTMAVPASAEVTHKSRSGEIITVDNKNNSFQTANEAYPKISTREGHGYQFTVTIYQVNPYQINPATASRLYLNTKDPHVEICGIFPSEEDDGGILDPTTESINLINQTLQEEHTNYQALPLSQQDSGTTTLS